MAELHQAVVDGVLTIWVESQLPLRAALFFRSGRVDETLVTSGETHLIEHMALSALGDTVQPHNGFVGGVVTGFLTLGRPEEVSDFLKRVCDALSSLPSDRLEAEKKVLAAENATRNYDVRSNLLAWRYGAAGYGLIALPELGLPYATIDQLRALCAERFTAENAVLWLSGPVPEGLRLNLPHGTKRPIPALQPLPQTFPNWHVDDTCQGIAASAIVPRISAATVFLAAVSRRLRNRLRSAQAVSYAPSVFYEPLNDEVAHLVLYADSERAHRAELAHEFAEVFKSLGEFDDSEIDAAREQIREGWTGSHAPAEADRVPLDAQRAGMDWILGHQFESIQELEAGMLAVSREDVQEFGSGVQANAIFALPSGVRLESCFGRAFAPRFPVVKGRTASSVDAPIIRERLIYGPDGVSWEGPNGAHTVRYTDLAAVLTYKDGGMRLVGSDAKWLDVEPTLWRDGQKMCADIRKRVPEQLVLDQGARSAEGIPRPQTTGLQRLRAQLTRR